MTSTDAELLQAFARHRDEAAFRELARRHLGLIFHTALRRTGNRTLAEDVTQQVLCAVARKAPELARSPERFAAWLHRAALFESSKAMRKEASQQRRDLLEHPDAISTTAEGDDSLWRKALPHLDTALDSLPESDRRVVVLHFFERQQFAQIAGLLGKSPDAVQKQSVRALEKLSRLLRTKGAAVSVGILATGLAIESGKAAPMAMLGSLTSTALSASAGLTTTQSLYLMLTTHSKIVVPCTLLVLALPLVLQQMAIARAEDELAGLRKGAGSPTASLVARKRPTGQAPGSELDLVKLADEAGAAETSELARIALKRKLAALEPEVLAAMLGDLLKTETSEKKRNLLARTLGLTLSQKDPALAMETASNGWMSGAAPGVELPWLLTVYETWLRADLPAAQAWLGKLEQRPRYVQQLDAEMKKAEGRDAEQRELAFGEDDMKDFRGMLVRALAAIDGRKLVDYLRSFPPDTWQTEILDSTLPGGVNYRDQAQLENWLVAIRELPEFGQRKLEDKLVQLAMSSVKGKWGLEPLGELMQAESHNLKDRSRLAEMAAGYYLLDDRVIEVDREAVLRVWLAETVPGEAVEIEARVRQSVERKWRERWKANLDSIDRGDYATDPDNMGYILSEGIFKGDLKERALAMVREKIKNPGARQHLEQQIEKNSQR